jgi:hypothetical protein
LVQASDIIGLQAGISSVIINPDIQITALRVAKSNQLGGKRFRVTYISLELTPAVLAERNGSG